MGPSAGDSVGAPNVDPVAQLVQEANRQLPNLPADQQREISDVLGRLHGARATNDNRSVAVLVAQLTMLLVRSPELEGDKPIGVRIPERHLVVERRRHLDRPSAAASRPSRKEMREWFDRLAASRPRRVLAHSRLETASAASRSITSRNPAKPFRSRPRSTMVGRPGGFDPRHPRAGRFVFEVAGELAGRGFGDAPHSTRDRPPCPRLDPPLAARPAADGRQLARRLGPGRTRTWLWVTRETVIGGAGLDPVYVLGAALHHAIAGPLFPKDLPTARSSSPAQGPDGPPAARSAVRAACPVPLEDDAAALERLILDCLEPNPSARPRRIRSGSGCRRLPTSWRPSG